MESKSLPQLFTNHHGSLQFLFGQFQPPKTLEGSPIFNLHQPQHQPSSHQFKAIGVGPMFEQHPPLKNLEDNPLPGQFPTSNNFGASPMFRQYQESQGPGGNPMFGQFQASQPQKQVLHFITIKKVLIILNLDLIFLFSRVKTYKVGCIEFNKY